MMMLFRKTSTIEVETLKNTTGDEVEMLKNSIKDVEEEIKMLKAAKKVLVKSIKYIEDDVTDASEKESYSIIEPKETFKEYFKRSNIVNVESMAILRYSYRNM